MGTEDKYGDYCTKTLEEKEAWIQPWQFQENFCARLSALRTEKALRSKYL